MTIIMQGENLKLKTLIFHSENLEVQESFGESGVAGRKIIKGILIKYKVRWELYWYDSRFDPVMMCSDT